jgi:hypothetical protein
VIVPWRDKGSPERRANFEFVHARLLADGWSVTVASDGQDGPFNRSAAYNAGRAQAPADVYVWHEADMLIPRAQLERGIELAAESPGLVVPFTEYRYFSYSDSCRILDGHPPEGFQPEHVMADGISIGAVGITSEATMRAVGQWDERFAGWGHDDNAMFAAFRVAAGRPRWVEGPGLHLWHPPGMQDPRREEQHATEQNYNRWLRYKNAESADLVRALTAGAD